MLIAESRRRYQQGDKDLEYRVGKLLKVLDLELVQYQNILDMLTKQREYSVTGGVEFFAESNKQIETIVLKIKILDEARKAIARKLACDLNVPPIEVTLAKIAMSVDSYYEAKCKAYQMMTLSLLGELEGYTESSAHMVRQALYYVNGILKIFASSYVGMHQISCDN